MYIHFDTPSIAAVLSLFTHIYYTTFPVILQSISLEFILLTILIENHML